MVFTQIAAVQDVRRPLGNAHRESSCRQTTVAVGAGA